MEDSYNLFYMLKINRLIEKITTHSFSQNIRPNKLLTFFKDILQFGLPDAQRTLEIENLDVSQHRLLKQICID